MSVMFGTLTPAYGCDYTSAVKLLADWNAGKDFQLNNPVIQAYCSIRDCADEPAGHRLQIRWKQLTHTTCIVKKRDGSYRLDH